MKTAELSSGSKPNWSTSYSPASRRLAKPAAPASPRRQPGRRAFVGPSAVRLLLVPSLNSGLPQQLAMLLLGHPLAALLDDGTHDTTLDFFPG